MSSCAPPTWHYGLMNPPLTHPPKVAVTPFSRERAAPSKQELCKPQQAQGTACLTPMLPPTMETPAWSKVGASWAQPPGAQPPPHALICVHPWSQPGARQPLWAAWALCPPARECPIQGCAKCIGSGTLADSWDPSRAGRLPGQAGFTPAGGLSASTRRAGAGVLSQQRERQGWGWRLQACWQGWAPHSSPERGCYEEGAPGWFCKPPRSPAHAMHGRHCTHG